MALEIDYDRLDTLIRETAKNHILPYYKSLEDSHIHTKSSPGDLVTIADHESEEAMTAELKKLYPDSAVIGEEAHHANPAILEALLTPAESPIWIVDPVDGTFNFRHGRRHFALILACVLNGETIAGWLYDILGDEMLIAEKGGGATLAGETLKTAAAKPVEALQGHAGYKYFSNKVRPHIKTLGTTVAEASSLSCAAHEYIRIASGRSDFGIYSKMRPWDHLAGTLAVKEAGGSVMKWDQTPYTPKDGSGGLIAAANEETWHKVATALGTEELLEKQAIG